MQHSNKYPVALSNLSYCIVSGIESRRIVESNQAITYNLQENLNIKTCRLLTKKLPVS